MLQIFLRNYLFLHCNELWPNVELVFSKVKSLECISTIAHLKEDPSMSILQRFDIEEADTKMMLHIFDCCLQGACYIFLLSSDTDVVALVLNFWSTFASHGLQVHYFSQNIINISFFINKSRDIEQHFFILEIIYKLYCILKLSI